MAETPTPAASAEEVRSAADAKRWGPVRAHDRERGATADRLEALADALDALRKAVKGCGFHTSYVGQKPYDCGDQGEVTAKLCGRCKFDLDVAVRDLIGVANG